MADIDSFKQFKTLINLANSYKGKKLDAVETLFRNLELVRWMDMFDYNSEFDSLLKQLAKDDCTMDGVKSICFDDMEQLNDEDLYALAKSFQNIISLNINSCPMITGTGCMAFRKLQTLALLSCKITDLGLEVIATITTLTILQLQGCTNITDDGIKSLGRLKNLIELDLSDTKIGNAGLKVIATITTLKILWLKMCTEFTDDGIKSLGSLQDLIELNLSHTKIGNAGLKVIATITSLKILWLWECTEFTDNGIKHIGDLKNLKKLSLSHTKIGNAGLKVIGDLKNLIILSLSHIKIGDDEIEYLGGLKNLIDLSLSDTKIGNAGLKVIGDLKNLRTLSLCGCTGVGCEGVNDIIERIQNLKILNICDTGITRDKINNTEAELNQRGLLVLIGEGPRPLNQRGLLVPIGERPVPPSADPSVYCQIL